MTFCYLEDTSILKWGEVGTGPSVAINEVSVEGGEGVDEGDEETGSTKAMYEYGVTAVDAVTDVVTLGQFAEDVLRIWMRTQGPPWSALARRRLVRQPSPRKMKACVAH